jgi:transcriptional regulator with XRE-family HTH domain
LSNRKPTVSPIAKRIKQARLKAGLSQRELGIRAKMDPSVASARINQYERQTHQPHYGLVRQFAQVLKTPDAFFYSADDELAEMIALFGQASARERTAILKKLRQSTAA